MISVKKYVWWWNPTKIKRLNNKITSEILTLVAMLPPWRVSQLLSFLNKISSIFITPTTSLIQHISQHTGTHHSFRNAYSPSSNSWVTRIFTFRNQQSCRAHSPSLQPLQLSSTQIQLSNVCQFGLLSRHSKRSAGFLWGGLWSNSATAQEISLGSRKETKQLTHANLSFKDSTLNRKYVSSLWYVLPRVTIAFVGTLVILLGNTRAISLL